MSQFAAIRRSQSSSGLVSAPRIGYTVSELSTEAKRRTAAEDDGVRATEQSGVLSAGSSIGWALVLAVLTALAIQLSVLTASASADDLSPVEATQDEAVAAPVPGDDGTTSESPAADPVPDPEVTSPEPAAPEPALAGACRALRSAGHR